MDLILACLLSIGIGLYALGGLIVVARVASIGTPRSRTSPRPALPREVKVVMIGGVEFRR